MDASAAQSRVRLQKEGLEQSLQRQGGGDVFDFVVPAVFAEEWSNPRAPRGKDRCSPPLMAWLVEALWRLAQEPSGRDSQKRAGTMSALAWTVNSATEVAEAYLELESVSPLRIVDYAVDVCVLCILLWHLRGRLHHSKRLYATLMRLLHSLAITIAPLPLLLKGLSQRTAISQRKQGDGGDEGGSGGASGGGFEETSSVAVAVAAAGGGGGDGSEETSLAGGRGGTGGRGESSHSDGAISSGSSNESDGDLSLLNSLFSKQLELCKTGLKSGSFPRRPLEQFQLVERCCDWDQTRAALGVMRDGNRKDWVLVSEAIAPLVPQAAIALSVHDLQTALSRRPEGQDGEPEKEVVRALEVMKM